MSSLKTDHKQKGEDARRHSKKDGGKEKKKKKKNDGERYKMLDQKGHKICDKAQEDWISTNCAKIKELEAQYKTGETYQKVKKSQHSSFYPRNQKRRIAPTFEPLV